MKILKILLLIVAVVSCYYFIASSISLQYEYNPGWKHEIELDSNQIELFNDSLETKNKALKSESNYYRNIFLISLGLLFILVMIPYHKKYSR